MDSFKSISTRRLKNKVGDIEDSLDKIDEDEEEIEDNGNSTALKANRQSQTSLGKID